MERERGKEGGLREIGEIEKESKNEWKREGERGKWIWSESE